MNQQQVYDAVVQARENFRNYGGAVGRYRNAEGKVCAHGAVQDVTRQGHIRYNATNFHVISEVFGLLHQYSMELFNLPIVCVNDQLGVQAVLDVYDYTIKMIEEEILLPDLNEYSIRVQRV